MDMLAGLQPDRQDGGLLRINIVLPNRPDQFSLEWDLLQRAVASGMLLDSGSMSARIVRNRAAVAAASSNSSAWLRFLEGNRVGGRSSKSIEKSKHDCQAQSRIEGERDEEEEDEEEEGSG